MTEEQIKMTLLMKAEIRKSAAELVLQEFLLAIFNSYEYEDGEEKVQAFFKLDDLLLIHRLFEESYQEQFNEFLSLTDQKQNDLIDDYINYKRECYSNRARDGPFDKKEL